MTTEQATTIAEEVFMLYEKFGSADYIGEPVSQLEHMCQSAQLAADEGAEEDTILAAFFHDLGHLCAYLEPTAHMDGYGVAHHEMIAGNFLRTRGFSEKIARLVEGHVDAKRYLTASNPQYLQRLSPASRITLEKQGGPMSANEMEQFRRDPFFDLHIKIREWDDAAKLEGQPLPPLDIYRAMTIRHLLSRN